MVGEIVSRDRSQSELLACALVVPLPGSSQRQSPAYARSLNPVIEMRSQSNYFRCESRSQITLLWSREFALGALHSSSRHSSFTSANLIFSPLNLTHLQIAYCSPRIWIARASRVLAEGVPVRPPSTGLLFARLGAFFLSENLMGKCWISQKVF